MIGQVGERTRRDRDSGVSTGIYYLALQNQLNGYMSNLYVGEKEAVKLVMNKQKRYFETVQGWHCDGNVDRGDTTLYLRAEPGGDIIMIVAIVELDHNAAQRYFELKQKALRENLPFHGIANENAGKTDILQPINPDTGEMYPVK